MSDPRTNTALASREELRLRAMQARNEERRQRFLNAKTRSLGVDVAYLDKQVAENAAAKEAEKIANMAYADEQRQIRYMMEMNILEERRQQVQERAEVAQAVQLQRDPRLRREWDLNNPDSRKNEVPPRVGDFDPRCGASSLQVFAGEDLKKGDRVKMQEMQMRDWCAQRKVEKSKRFEKEAMEDRAYARHVLDVVQITSEIEEREQEEKAVEALEVRETNQQLAAAKAFEISAYKQSEEKQRLAELAHTASDPFLNEHRATGISAISMGRVRPDHWKGMNTNQLKEIYEIQQRQVAEKQAIKARQMQEDASYSEYERSVLNMTQQAYLMEQEEAKADQFVIRAHQAKQIVEKHTRDLFLKKERAGAVNDDFFKGFGSSHR
jgi:hypothetical protein